MPAGVAAGGFIVAELSQGNRLSSRRPVAVTVAVRRSGGHWRCAIVTSGNLLLSRLSVVLQPHVSLRANGGAQHAVSTIVVGGSSRGNEWRGEAKQPSDVSQLESGLQLVVS